MIFTPAADEIVRRPLGRVGRDREHADDDVLLAHELAEPVVRLDRDVPDRLPDLRRIGVDDRGDVDPVLGEDRGRRDRLAEPAGADERDVVLALRPQDLPDRVEQRSIE